MRITRGAFSFLPDLTEEQIRRQVDYCIANDWVLAIEFAEDVPERDTHWDSWALPMFDVRDAAAVMGEIRACRAAHPACYIRVNAIDPVRGWETVRLSFIIGRPRAEPVVRFGRAEAQARAMRYRAPAAAVAERRFGGARF